jgi:hypothetical protein
LDVGSSAVALVAAVLDVEADIVANSAADVDGDAAAVANEVYVLVLEVLIWPSILL